VNEYNSGMGTTPGMWEMLSECLDGEKLPESLNTALYALRDGTAMVVIKPSSGERKIAEDLIGCIPTNWSDPLLTGPDKVLRSTQPYRVEDIERLLKALRKRMKEKLDIVE